MTYTLGSSKELPLDDLHNDEEINKDGFVS